MFCCPNCNSDSKNISLGIEPEEKRLWFDVNDNGERVLSEEDDYGVKSEILLCTFCGYAFEAIWDNYSMSYSFGKRIPEEDVNINFKE